MLTEILDEYKRGLAEILGPILTRVILYGSQARRDAENGSDVDILCVINGPFDYGDLIRRTSHLTASLSLKYDVVLSRVFVEESEYQHNFSPFLMNVRKEGVLV